jgi:hypothetical protein
MAIGRALKNVVTFGLLGMSIGSCEFQRAQDASVAQVSMVGMPKEQVLACMGSPAKTAAIGNTEVWTYNSGDGRMDTFGAADGFGGRGWTAGFGSSTTVGRFCKVDVVMNASRVSRINYSGPTGGLLTQGEQCGYAVTNCAHAVAAIGGSAPDVQMAAPQPVAANVSCRMPNKQIDRFASEADCAGHGGAMVQVTCVQGCP